MTYHFKQALEDKPTESVLILKLYHYLKRFLKNLLSPASGTCGMDHYVLVGFIFQIQPVLLMCKHVEEKRDFTYCPDEQRPQGH